MNLAERHPLVQPRTRAQRNSPNHQTTLISFAVDRFLASASRDPDRWSLDPGRRWRRLSCDRPIKRSGHHPGARHGCRRDKARHRSSGRPPRRSGPVGREPHRVGRYTVGWPRLRRSWRSPSKTAYRTGRRSRPVAARVSLGQPSLV